MRRGARVGASSPVPSSAGINNTGSGRDGGIYSSKLVLRGNSLCCTSCTLAGLGSAARTRALAVARTTERGSAKLPPAPYKLVRGLVADMDRDEARQYRQHRSAKTGLPRRYRQVAATMRQPAKHF